MTKKGKIDQAVDVVVNTGSDLLDKISSPASRSGSTVERAAKMARSGVARTAIAAQLSSGSATGHQYTTAEVDTMVVVYADCETKSPLTKAATMALIEDAKDNTCGDGSELPA